MKSGIKILNSICQYLLIVYRFLLKEHTISVPGPYPTKVRRGSPRHRSSEKLLILWSNTGNDLKVYHEQDGYMVPMS